MKIDITTSATIRPGLLHATLSSFRDNLLSTNHDYRLIINVDPAGEKDKTANDVIEVAKSHFDDVVFRTPKSPCFAKAVIWCWSQVESDLVFHLEDDWVMLRPIDLDKMLGTIAEFTNFDSFRLAKQNQKCSKQRVKPYDRLSLNPVFIRKEFIKKAVQHMSPDKNPEKQLRAVDPECGKFIKKTSHGVYVEQGSGIIVRDIGREWMESNGVYVKPTGFLQWKKRK